MFVMNLEPAFKGDVNFYVDDLASLHTAAFICGQPEGFRSTLLQYSWGFCTFPSWTMARISEVYGLPGQNSLGLV